MAIRSIKEIVENNIYRIDEKSRKIFQEGDIQSFFGMNDDDVIEFILYDANDNQLPQSDGELVRYIPLDSDVISDYFFINEGSELTYNKLPSEYYIDVERLIREAGYNNGIFKVQVSLLNNRLGSSGKVDRIWIKDISPSRTELRVFPLAKNNTPQRLAEVYKSFVNGKSFWRDVSLAIDDFIEGIDATQILTEVMSKYADSGLLDRMSREFGKTIDEIVAEGIQLAKTAITYEFQSKVSDPGDVNFGNPTNTSLEFISIDDVVNKCKALVLLSMDIVIPNRETNDEAVKNIRNSTTSFQLNQVLQSISNDVQITTAQPIYSTEVRQLPDLINRDILYEFKFEDEEENTDTTTPTGTSSGGGDGDSGDGNNNRGTTPNEDGPAQPNDGEFVDSVNPVITTTFQYF